MYVLYIDIYLYIYKQILYIHTCNRYVSGMKKLLTAPYNLPVLLLLLLLLQISKCRWI